MDSDDAIDWISKNLPDVTLTEWQKTLLHQIYDYDYGTRGMLYTARRNGMATLLSAIEAYESRARTAT